MKINELLTEIKVSMSSFEDMGLINDASVYRWAEMALRRFGGTIATPTEEMIEAKNKQAILPNDFFDLISAYRCDPSGIEVDGSTKYDKAELQHEFAWKERTERGFRWCSCDECCKEEFEKTVTERFYIKGHDVKFHYKNPVKLVQKGSFKRDNCLDKYRDQFEKDDITYVRIHGNKLYTMFDGYIYIKYRGLPFDEDNLPYIPDTPLGYLALFVETYIKKNIVFDAITNKNVPGATELYKVLSQEEMIYFVNAERECKMMHITPESFRNIQQSNRRRMQVYENMFPDMSTITKIV